MRPLTESDLRELISTIARADRERQSLGEHLRSQLIAELETCLVDPDRLDAHLQAVQQVAQASVREGTLPEEREKLVVEQGLSDLSDDELLHLALSPDALVNLSDQIRLNEYWADRFVQAAEAEIEALPEDRRQALLARMDAFEREFSEVVRKDD